MKLNVTTGSLVIALCLISAPTHSVGNTVDYTLRWSRSPLAFDDTADIGTGSLYRRFDKATPTIDTNALGTFQLIEPHLGFSYATRLRFTSEGDSSRSDLSPINYLYQIGYGEQHSRLYSGINLSVERFDGEYRHQAGDLWSLDLTAGGHIALTGLGRNAPLWLLSLSGEYNAHLIANTSTDSWINRGSWFITPSLQWNEDDFSLSAGVQMPVNTLDGALGDEPPDYRIRADFKKYF